MKPRTVKTDQCKHQAESRVKKWTEIRGTVGMSKGFESCVVGSPEEKENGGGGVFKEIWL